MVRPPPCSVRLPDTQVFERGLLCPWCQDTPTSTSSIVSDVSDTTNWYRTVRANQFRH